MKTYILRTPKAVEPQNQTPNPRSQSHRNDPGATATGNAICSPPTPPPALGPRVLYVGLDVHNDTIAVSLTPNESPEVRRYGIIGG